MSMRAATGFLVLAIALSARELGAEQPPAAESQPLRSPSAGSTRLFLAPTARTPRRGTGSFALTEIVFPWGEVGLTDRASVRVFAIPPLADLSSAGVVIEPKLQLYGGSHVQAAAGVVQLLSTSQGDSGGVGYGVVTLGRSDASVTVGYGYGYGGVSDSSGPRGLLFVGAEKAISRHFRLVAEGYAGGGALGLPDRTIVVGGRFSSGRFSADLAVVVPFYETGSGMPGPLVTIGWAF